MYKTIITFLKRFFSESQIYKYGFNWSPMYRRTTARVIDVSKNLHYVKIRIPINWKNRNYAGSIFGGSMLSATDPIYMIQLIQILGDNFVVWDKTASIKYKRPAKETIYGEFIFSDGEIQTIKQQLLKQNELEITKTMTLENNKKIVFAEITKTIYIANKLFYKEKLKQRNLSKK